jgi:DNA-binding MarR family transcriptional regulator
LVDPESVVADYRTVSRALRAATCEWRDLQLSMAQVKALFVLQDAGRLTVGGLAAQLGTGLPAASLLADRLVHGGLVQREVDPANRRCTLLRLSGSGESLATRLQQGSLAVLTEWMSRLAGPDLEALAQGLHALARVAQASGDATEAAAR